MAKRTAENWVLEKAMVAPIHLLYPGGQFVRGSR
jgi:hypothetical protein